MRDPITSSRCLIVLAVVLLAVSQVRAAPATTQAAPLWEIGRADGNNAEFALAPRDWGKFEKDSAFLVGTSGAKRDWAYVQPGPVDAWAGGRAHTNVIVFALGGVGEGQCRLVIDYLDTQYAHPPKLVIRVNDAKFEKQLPGGAGDASLFGEPGKGKAGSCAVEFPASALRKGVNEVAITTVAGCWLLYDRVAMEAPAGCAVEPVKTWTGVVGVSSPRGIVEREGRAFQPVMVKVRHAGEAAEAVLSAPGAADVSMKLGDGEAAATLYVPAVAQAMKVAPVVRVGAKTIAAGEVELKPVKKLLVYILPHSHTDIGYTDIQSAIETKQVNNLLTGIEYAKQTASYPEGARFVWNVEVLWAADLYLRRLDEAQKAEFLRAVRDGQVVLNGMYLNELTGLCRPEELVRLFKYATELSKKTGVAVNSAMISDVPGYTWGTVTAMNAAGIKYFSVAPNYIDRIGTILREWENKPFWWVGPDGKSKVLVWIPYMGYAMSHTIGGLSDDFVGNYLDQHEKRGYPYDVTYMRWSGHGDNAVPEKQICDFVKSWNERYAWPRFEIAGTGKAFSEFEKKYGEKLPEVKGDWTPYWEDGAGSSALETAMNRASADRLIQAEAMDAMLRPEAYSAGAFADAWNAVLLYSEHTWGAWCSVSDPQRKETLEQWEVKRGYAVEAEKRSKELLGPTTAPAAAGIAVDVYNTSSWFRGGLVTLSPVGGDWPLHAVDEQGNVSVCQRLRNDEVVFMAQGVPPLGAKRYSIKKGAAGNEPRHIVVGTLDNGLVKIVVDHDTGAIASCSVGGGANLVDSSGGELWNDYLYLIGDDVKALQRTGSVSISSGEAGPLVWSMKVTSEAPGCEKLVREYRLTAGSPKVEITNTLSKKRLPGPDYRAQAGKESLNIAFPFAVPGGRVRVDSALAVARPDEDQMPSACKNWFTAGRFVDVSNEKMGVTWITLDAPLVEVGGITANLLNSQANPDTWRKTVGPTQKIYSWALNNHWHTNYRAYQDGTIMFRYAIVPHAAYDAGAAQRAAIESSQPLLVSLAKGETPADSLLALSDADVQVIGLKPSDDGKGFIVRLFNPTDRAIKVSLAGRRIGEIHRSDTSEKPGEVVESVETPAMGLATVYIERK